MKIITLLIIISSLVLSSCEREWTAKTDDCREIVNIKDWDIQSFYKTFTCSYSKTSKWDIISGSCISLETWLFGNKCELAYAYDKKPFKTCQEGEYLNYSWNCECSYWVKEGSKCISYDEKCRISYWDNSLSYYSDNSQCVCKSWYEWSTDKTRCVIKSIY